MIVRLYQLTDKDKNVVGRSVGNLPYYELNGELRDSMDIMNPQLIIDISETSNISAYSIPEDEEEQTEMIRRFRESPFNLVNYVYIPYLKRYYWITNIILLRKNIIQFSLHVDVLQFSRFIEAQFAFVARNETMYNALLPDERRIVLNEEEIIIKPITNIDYGEDVYIEFDTYFSNEDDTGTNVYNIIALGHTTGVNRSVINNNNVVTSFDSGVLPDVRTGNFAPLNAKTYVLSRLEIAHMLNYVNNVDSNLAGSIGGIYAYPIDFKKSFSLANWNALETTFSLGTVDMREGIPAHRLNTLTSGYLWLSSFVLENSPSDFNDLSPYSIYELYIPYYGYFELNYNSLRGHTIDIYYVVNYQTGSATVIIYDATNHCIVTSLQCQLGIEIPKNTSNIKEVIDRHNANNLSMVFGLFGSALSVVVGALSYNPVAVAGGVLGAGKTIGDYTQNEKTNRLKEQTNFNGSTAPLFAPQKPFIRQRRKKIQYQLTTDFLHNNGAVLNQLLMLSTLSGYTEIADIPVIYYPDHIGDIPTDNEVTEIINLLKSGVIFL